MTHPNADLNGPNRLLEPKRIRTRKTVYKPPVVTHWILVRPWKSFAIDATEVRSAESEAQLRGDGWLPCVAADIEHAQEQAENARIAFMGAKK